MNTQQTEINWQEVYTNLETRLDGVIEQVGTTAPQVFDYMVRMEKFEGLSMFGVAIFILLIISVVIAKGFKKLEKKTWCFEPDIVMPMIVLPAVIGSMLLPLPFMGMHKVMFPEYHVVKELISFVK
jgi:hypothetical protein